MSTRASRALAPRRSSTGAVARNLAPRAIAACTSLLSGLSAQAGVTAASQPAPKAKNPRAARAAVCWRINAYIALDRKGRKNARQRSAFLDDVQHQRNLRHAPDATHLAAR